MYIQCAAARRARHRAWVGQINWLKGYEKRGTATTETSSEMSSEVIKNRSKIDQKSMINWWKKEEFASRKEVRAPLGRLLAPRWLPDLKMTLRLEARATILEANGGRMEPRRRSKCSQNHEKIDRKNMEKNVSYFLRSRRCFLAILAPKWRSKVIKI